MSSQLVSFGRSWYVPVHDAIRGHRAVGRRPRAPGRPRRDGGRPPTGSRRPPSCCAAASSGSSRPATAPRTTSRTRSGWRRSRASGPGPPIVARAVRDRRLRERFRWRPGDAVLAVSSSGEFRDVVEIAQRARRAPVRRDHRAARTPRSRPPRPPRSLQRVGVAARGDAHAGAGGRVRVRRWRCGRRVTGDAELGAALGGAPDAAAARGRRGRGVGRRRRSPTLGARPPRSSSAAAPAWAAALELALMLKEIARIPAEGVETREGATSAMFGLDRGHLMVLARPAGRPARRRGAAPVRGHRRGDAAAARRRRRRRAARADHDAARGRRARRPRWRSPPATTSTTRPGPTPTTRPRGART